MSTRSATSDSYGIPAGVNHAKIASRKRGTEVATISMARSRLATGEQRRHPSTSDAGYDSESCAYLRAMDEFIRRTGRRFPTWIEALAVAKAIGYRKVVSEAEETEVRLAS